MSKLGLLALSLLCLVCISLPACCDPAIKVSQVEYNIGDIYLEQSKTAIFSFKNVGNEDLQIIRFEKSCGCTNANAAPAKILPGKSSTIKVDYAAKNNNGPIKESIVVVTNDPVNPNVRLLVTGNIIPVATLTPSILNFGTAQSGSELHQIVTLTPTKPDEFNITKIESSGKCVSATVEPTTKGSKSYKLKIKIKAASMPGRLVERLTVFTGMNGDLKVRLLVYGNVEPQTDDERK